jgi:elongation factor Ts
MSLMQQVFVKDPAGKKTIAQYLKESDPQAKVLKFVRFGVGEGIEKKKEDFAEEVAKMAR